MVLFFKERTIKMTGLSKKAKAVKPSSTLAISDKKILAKD